jgi:hypothetical protein
MGIILNDNEIEMVSRFIDEINAWASQYGQDNYEYREMMARLIAYGNEKNLKIDINKFQASKMNDNEQEQLKNMYFNCNEIFNDYTLDFQITFIAGWINDIIVNKNHSEIMEQSLEKALIKNKFKADISYLSDDYLSGIAINKNEHKIGVFKRFNVKEDFSPSIYNFNEIVECSIKEDGDTVINTVNQSFINRAIAGGVLFGGIGAVVGGLSGEKIGYAKIYKSTLSIVVNDLNNPIYEIHFLNSKTLIDRDSEMYKDIYYEMNKWHKRISVILKRNELNTRTV